MNWLQIRLFGPYFSSFSTNSYGYYSQTSQNLDSNSRIFASARIVRQAARRMDFQIPDKLYFKIGEVAKFTGLKTHVLRYWETEFSAIKPNKSRSNQRLYRRRDVDTILYLKDLLYNQGFTIAGARKKLREKPAKIAVVAVEESPSKKTKTVKASDQLTLPLSGSYNPELLKEIRQDILHLKKSLEAKPRRLSDNE